MIRIVKEEDIIIIDASGKLTVEDYDGARHGLEQSTQGQEKARLLIRLKAFQGWGLKAWLEDMRVNFRHRKTFQKVAIVCERRREALVVRLLETFFKGRVKRFDSDQVEHAKSWLRQ